MQCPIWLVFCSSLISCCPGILLTYCLSDFEMVPVAPVLIGITCTFTWTEFLLQGLRILEYAHNNNNNYYYYCKQLKTIYIYITKFKGLPFFTNATNIPFSLLKTILNFNQQMHTITLKGKGKVISLQARCGPEGGYRYSSTLPWPRH